MISYIGGVISLHGMSKIEGGNQTGRITPSGTATPPFSVSQNESVDVTLRSFRPYFPRMRPQRTCGSKVQGIPGSPSRPNRRPPARWWTLIPPMMHGFFSHQTPFSSKKETESGACAMRSCYPREKESGAHPPRPAPMASLPTGSSALTSAAAGEIDD